MYATAERGIDFQIGTGIYRFRFTFHSHEGVLLRVPFLGKFWAYGPGFTGRTTWAEVKLEGPCMGD